MNMIESLLNYYFSCSRKKQDNLNFKFYSTLEWRSCKRLCNVVSMCNVDINFPPRVARLERLATPTVAKWAVDVLSTTN